MSAELITEVKALREVKAMKQVDGAGRFPPQFSEVRVWSGRKGSSVSNVVRKERQFTSC